MKIRILLADDHKMFRDGLRAILEYDSVLEVVGEASNGRQAVELACGVLDPQIIIMDFEMPELNGSDATRQILNLRPEVKVIALSAHADSRFVSAMLESGASGYVLKNAASEELLHAIHTVTAGHKYLSLGVSNTAIEGHLGEAPNGKNSQCPLGLREREALQLLAEGKTSKQIAQILHISSRTVEVHRRNIMEKLKLNSVAELTKYAVREGITSG